jgi:hypothetical protein
MKRIVVLGWGALLLCSLLACKKSAPLTTPAPGDKTFTIFNAMQYQNMPDLTSQGLKPISLINETSLFTSSTNLAPDSSKIAVLATQSNVTASVPVVFDIEDWSYSSSELDTTIAWFLEVIRVFKQTYLGSMGFYGVVPNDAYNWDDIEPVGGATYIKWQTLNTALTPIADQIDLFFPSFYTDDNDTTSWNEFVQATLSELKKYPVHKPVYAFLWPQYHDGTPNQYQFLDTAVWRYELETLYPLVDGIVIWSSSKIIAGVDSDWNPSWPWWVTTEAFISEHNIQ